MNPLEIYLLSFSGGRSSAMMCEEWLRQEANRPQSIVAFCNTGLEDEATLVFVRRCGERWRQLYDIEMVWLEFTQAVNAEGKLVKTFRIVDFDSASRDGRPFAEMLEYCEGLPNLVARNCTAELKIRTIKRYMMSLGVEHWTNFIGIRYDEPRRIAKAKNADDRQRWDTDMPLVWWQVTKADVLDYWRDMPFDLEIENEAFGNCSLCFLKGKGKKLHVLRKRPELANFWLEWERRRPGYRFNNRYTVQQLMDQIRSSPTLFDDRDEEPDLECFCNSD